MNYLKTAILLAGLTALFMGVGYLIGGQAGAMLALLVAAAMNLFTYWNEGHGVRDLIGLERIRHHGHGAERVQHRLLRIAVGHAVDLMTRSGQARHQFLADRSRRTCNKHPHPALLQSGIVLTPIDEPAAPTVTPPSTSGTRSAGRGVRHRKGATGRGPRRGDPREPWVVG